MTTYAGIGSRATPPKILAEMETIAAEFARAHWVLRSGHAPGADQAFERGAGGRAEVYLPWPSFEAQVRVQSDHLIDHPSKAAHELAAEHHPNWLNLKQGPRQLHARNGHQILGQELDSPAACVICWTSNGSLDGADWEATGGTGQALRIAAAHGVPVFNLAVDGHFDEALGMIFMDH